MNKEMIDRVALCVRTLTLDAIEQAQSGHPGLAMGVPEWGAVFYGEILKHYPKVPSWPDRDRFVLSAGHGSMLLYALLHLAGYDLSLDDLRAFRQLGSRTPGHPEHGVTPGVETSTGPLGQGFANAVGMAIAERFLAATFNTKEHTIIDHFTYVLVGDGDMMEGVSSEVASLAGAQGLGKLIVYYDSNRITIDGPTDLTFREDVAARFRAYGWHTCEADAYEPEQILACTEQAQGVTDRPSLVVLRSTIGKGSPKFEDTAAAHGSQFGAEEVALIKRNHSLPAAETFRVDSQAQHWFADRLPLWKRRYESWQKTFTEWGATNPELLSVWKQFFEGAEAEIDALPVFSIGDQIATRVANGQTLDAILPQRPNLIGGCADLTVPCFGRVPAVAAQSRDNPTGRYIYYGVREHAMGGISNGLALHGGLRPYCATFMVFSDYMRPAIRMAALMKLPVIYALSHDSVKIGQDGPTHQPVEHLAALRAIPGLTVLRPADAEETVQAWLMALENRDGPTVIAMTRYNVPVVFKESKSWQNDLKKGAHVVRQSHGVPALVVVATGADVSTALAAVDRTGRHDVRVVSMISRERFLKTSALDRAYRSKILGEGAPIMVVEAGVSMGWHELSAPDAPVLGMTTFGVSAPGPVAYEHFGFGVESVAQRIKDAIAAGSP